MVILLVYLEVIRQINDTGGLLPAPVGSSCTTSGLCVETPVKHSKGSICSIPRLNCKAFPSVKNAFQLNLIISRLFCNGQQLVVMTKPYQAGLHACHGETGQHAMTKGLQFLDNNLG